MRGLARRLPRHRDENLPTRQSFKMTSSKFIAMFLVLAAPILAWAQGAPNGDPAAGARKTAMCGGCHGIDGWRTAYPEVYSVPKIGGQHQVYIVKALQAYKSGERSHPSMKAIAATLSDQDMADLAAYYGAAPAKTASNK
jgi:cytochrome c553